MPTGLSSLLKLITGPTARNMARVGAGGTAGYFANDAYLGHVNPETNARSGVNPDVSDVGRMRSNMLSAVLAGTLASKGVGRRLYQAQPISVARTSGRMLPKIGLKPAVGGAGLAAGTAALGARYGLIMPEDARSPIGFGLGDRLDPGHSPIPKLVADVKDPVKRDEFVNTVTKPVEGLTNFSANKAVDELLRKMKDPKERADWAKDMTENYLPPAYSYVIEQLGGKKPSEKPTIGDVGMALAPHIAGGAGGAYLGSLAGGGLGNFFFKDNPKDDYEERRRQEQRRWWLEFLGGNLGMVGGTMATMNAMPHLNKMIGKATHVTPPTPAAQAAKQAAEKVSFGPMTGAIPAKLFRALSGVRVPAPTSFGAAVADTALAGGLTAAQYGAGIVPPGSYDAEGNPEGPNKSLGLPLFLTNLAATKALGARKVLTGAKSFSGPNGFRSGPITKGLTLGAAATAAPSVVNMYTALPDAIDATKRIRDGWNDGNNNDVGGLLRGDLDSIAGGAQRALKRVYDKRYNEVEEGATETAKDVMGQAGVPGMPTEEGKKSLKELLSAAALSTAAQGAGLATGGVAGLTAGDWLVDKALTAGVRNKWLKKRPGLHRFLRDMGSVAGGALGAYGGLKAIDYASSKFGPKAAPADPVTEAVKKSFELRTPPLSTAAGSAAIAALVSGGLGAARGAMEPGYDETVNEKGHITSRKRRNPYMGALRNALFAGAIGAGGNYVSQVAQQYSPEVNQFLAQYIPQSAPKA